MNDTINMGSLVSYEGALVRLRTRSVYRDRNDVLSLSLIPKGLACSSKSTRRFGAMFYGLRGKYDASIRSCADTIILGCYMYVRMCEGLPRTEKLN